MMGRWKVERTRRFSFHIFSASLALVLVEAWRGSVPGPLGKCDNWYLLVEQERCLPPCTTLLESRRNQVVEKFRATCPTQ